ncbi:MAG TPA: metallophosphoesterase [Xanthobacteraceae bacterium]
MIESGLQPGSDDGVAERHMWLVDPRDGDVEDDVSSPKRRSLVALFGSLLVEVSIPKLLFAWTTLILLPALLLGLAPVIAATWLKSVPRDVAESTEFGTALVFVAILGLGWIGWRPLLRIAEVNFWSLNADVVQPVYVFCREALRYLGERTFGGGSAITGRGRVRAISSAAAGVLLCGCGLLLALLVWPASRWVGTMADVLSLRSLAVPTLANAVVLICAYLAIASLIWGFADATMDQPNDLDAFDAGSSGPRWRVAHLSDIHLVGERYGFRIESGRSGPRGNDRFAQIMAQIAAIHEDRALDLILISGDLTDAGRATEWAEFLDAAARHPQLVERMIVLPGNHDLNIVDRLNPARLDLPFSPSKRLRQMRALSALAAVQGHRVHVVDRDSGKLGRTLAEALVPYRRRIAAFADLGSLRLAVQLRRVWDQQFPMILPPTTANGLGVLILDSNAETHFSFTNALGMVSAEQTARLAAAIARFPEAYWIIALHHHLLEYPMSAATLSERIGTALINGSWFVRRLKSFAARAVVMHGHRHIDWIGACGKLKIISAPSPIMGAKNDVSTYFYIHTLAPGLDGQLRLLPPERVEVAGVSSPD